MKRLLVLLTLSLLFATPVSAAELAPEYEQTVENCAEVVDIDPSIVKALIETESGNNPNAVNSAGTCFGLCQINQCHRDNAKKLGFGDPTKNPYSNIAYCCMMLKENYDAEGDWNRALVKYNAGYVYADSSSYSRKILARAQEIREEEFAEQRIEKFENKGGSQ